MDQITCTLLNFLPRYSREFFDAPRGFSKQSQSDDEENLVSSAAAASIPFKALFIPSVKEVRGCVWLPASMFN